MGIPRFATDIQCLTRNLDSPGNPVCWLVRHEAPSYVFSSLSTHCRMLEFSIYHLLIHSLRNLEIRLYNFDRIVLKSHRTLRPILNESFLSVRKTAEPLKFSIVTKVSVYLWNFRRVTLPWNGITTVNKRNL